MLNPDYRDILSAFSDEIEVDGLPVQVIDRMHLARNKEATGRPQDHVDLEWLRKDGLEDEKGP